MAIAECIKTISGNVGEQMIHIVRHLQDKSETSRQNEMREVLTGDMVPPAKMTALASSTISRKWLVGSRSI
jgi:hypothetical protein